MSKRDRWAEREAAESVAELRDGLQRVLSTERHFDAPLNGLVERELLFRLAWDRSFEPLLVWEIWSVQGQLVAFRLSGAEPGSQLVAAPELLAAGDTTLRRVLDELSLVAVPLTHGLPYVPVADGATFLATIRVGVSTSIRLSWCEDRVPKSWESAVRALVRVKDLLEQPVDISRESSTPLSVSYSGSTAQLVRLSSGEFHVWAAGELGILVCGPDHILANAALADALQAACGDDLEVVPAKISSRASGESWSSYRELRPRTELGGPEGLPAARLSDCTVWLHSGGDLFVSPHVRAKLEPLFPELEFSEGFSRFVGY